tara:strand:- start:5649 stop:7127 length:1479 start_codon:yes stop_codon:yes gene_type:complete
MNNKKIKILLATISSEYEDWAPYPVACLISHCLKNPRIRKKYEFLEPEYKHNWNTDEFKIKLKNTDILGLTNYVWNQVSNDNIAKKFKKINSKGIVIYGGPNVPEKNLNEYKRNFVDYYITGPGELKLEKILDPKSDSIYAIPTPYTDGVLNNILKTRVATALETNRGCPYHCAFCDWGGVARSKITKVKDEDVYKTIDHILKYKPKRLEILDANFGIFARDLEFVKYIAKNKTRNDMLLTFAGFAKNGTKWMPDIMNVIMDNFNDKMRNVKISLQTFTPEVLNTINRNNIKTEKLMSVLNQLQDVTVNSELIIGLPGETSRSWLNTLFKHQEYKIDFARAYPLYVLPNTPMSQKEYKEKYKIKTKKLILPNGEQFEMIYECYSYDLKELKKIYLSWLYFNSFYNFGLNKNITKNEILYYLDNPLKEMKTHEVEEALDRIFKPEKEYNLNNFDYRFIHKGLGRGNELVYMKRSGYPINNPESELRSPFTAIK